MCNSRRNFAGLFLCATLFAPLAHAAEAPVPQKLRFNRDIAPILSENCFKCHGFDAKERKADLRLDTKEGLIAKRKDITPIVPGDPSKSEIYRRIVTTDSDDLMPPAKSGKKLSQWQKDLIKLWIEQGMDWEPHWSFTKIERPNIPKVKDAAWVRNPVDAFILEKLERAGQHPSPEADKITLIRRLTLDLTGLPPTPAEVDAFTADASPNAYEKVVDRLLASPRYGERMGLDWLDAARYADTNGYHIDTMRNMTKWREYVIDAFNSNKPFDVFTTEQLAGDLLPNSTIEQKVASGFNRNHMINFEGGAIPEEYQTAYLIDRTNTTGSVFLGLTVGCTQCHDHKYDPIKQTDYYSLMAFFNNIPENGLDGRNGNAVPMIKTPSGEESVKLASLTATVNSAQEKLKAPMPDVAQEQLAWEGTAKDEHAEWVMLDPIEMTSAGGATLKKQPDKSILANRANPDKETYTVVAETSLKDVTAIRVEALPDKKMPSQGPGRSSNGNAVLTDFHVSIGDSSTAMPIKKASADFSQADYPVAAAIDNDPASGWAIYPEVGKRHDAVFEFAEPIASADSNAKTKLIVVLDFKSPFGQHQFGKFRLSVTTAKDPHGRKSLPANITKLLAIAPDDRTDAQRDELRKYYVDNVSPAMRKLKDQFDVAKKQRDDFEAAIPTAMVMQEMAKPRDTFVLIRGAYDNHGEKVSMNTPGFLPPMDAGWPKNRLGLAKWLLDDKQPLTSRVTVNRFWQSFFGTGIVKTSEDFGSQGELPSHRELLDWLASEFMNNSAGKRWDVKSFVKMLVMSSTYRQSSNMSGDAFVQDPENRLLARGPRFRLQAEFIRDQALAVSGLLDARIGGQSVMPYQPAGLWEELMSRADGANFSAQVYVQSHGPDLYRRSMYTFWKRTSPPPQMATFDAPDRETCTVKRSRTNTPLQALVLLNDPTYVEASRKLAERVMREGGSTLEDRITFAFRQPLSRKPSSDEIASLKKLFDEQLAHYRSTGGAADAAKLLAVGESPSDAKLNVPELAAWTTISSVILNLDETLTKG